MSLRLMMAKKGPDELSCAALQRDGRWFWLDEAIAHAERDGKWQGRPEASLDALLNQPSPRRALDALLARLDAAELIEDEPQAELPLRQSDLFCIGRNYVEHAHELGNEVPTEPIVFLKPRSSLLAHDRNLPLPQGVQELHYEGELALVLGPGLGRQQGDPLEALFAVTLMNDFTDRSLQSRLKEKGHPWLAAKGGRGFAPLGPVLRVLESPEDLNSLELVTSVNGQQRQRGGPGLWIFSAEDLLAHLSQRYAPLAGSLVATGTPKGVAPVAAGDVVEVSEASIGTLRTRLVGGAGR